MRRITLFLLCGCRTYEILVDDTCNETVESSLTLGQASTFGLSSDDVVAALSTDDELPVEQQAEQLSPQPPTRVTSSFTPTAVEVRSYDTDEYASSDCPVGEERLVVAGTLTVDLEGWLSVTRTLEVRMAPDGTLDTVSLNDLPGNPALVAALEEAVGSSCQGVTGGVTIDTDAVGLAAYGDCDNGTYGVVLLTLTRP